MKFAIKKRFGMKSLFVATFICALVMLLVSHLASTTPWREPWRRPPALAGYQQKLKEIENEIASSEQDSWAGEYWRGQLSGDGQLYKGAPCPGGRSS